MTEEKRSFRINIVDVLITIVIACVIAVGAIMIANAFGVDASTDKESLTVEYTLQFNGLQPEFAEKVQAGDAVVEAAKRLGLGTVVSVQSEPYTKDVYNEETGMMQVAEHPDYVTVYITIAADGYTSDEMYYVNGVKMAVGTGISIHTKNFCGTGYVSEMLVK
ncbi:MAG: DUF4330 domain-containing protein [Clostridia bacterium]|nr:DUF4330 domain-containing protein [Clostridia bacterium]